MVSTGFTLKKQQRFLAALADMPNVSRACRLAAVSRVTVYNLRSTDPEFAAAWDEAKEHGIEKLEEAAWDRAERTSDTLMIFLLKAVRPDVYRETTRHEVTGADGGVLKIVLKHPGQNADD